jgi:enediyne biosynthesis protein E4
MRQRATPIIPGTGWRLCLLNSLVRLWARAPGRAGDARAARRKPRHPRFTERHLACAVLILCACSSDGLPTAAHDHDQESPASIAFQEVAAQSGIAFQFDNGSRGKHDLPEIMGGGLALFDADGDGLLDIYLCNGGPIDASEGKPDPPCRLFRNRGGWQFEDVTQRAAAPGPSYAMGAATADYDGDGRLDLFITGWRDQRLYRNLGNCRFEDVTERAGLKSSLWSTSAAFADLDGDGDLDLYVANYLEYDVNSPPFCAAPDGRRDYCGPEDFAAQPHRLYRNNGDGTFTDVSITAGISAGEGRGLGVLIAELTGDNRPDIYVANDGTPCWLFANQGNLRFKEIGEQAGVARDGQGQALAGMGVATADLDGDGFCELVVSNFFNRSTIAFQPLAGQAATYREVSRKLGLAAATRDVLGFGLALVDFDGDGHNDLIQANGHVLDRARLGVPFAMRPTLLQNTRGAFQEIGEKAGPWFRQPVLGRGLAAGDLDGDSKPDFVVNCIDAPAAVLRNVSDGNHFLALDIIDKSGRPAVGARVEVRAGGCRHASVVTAGGSYLAAAPARLFFGLGRAQSVERIDVTWPWGISESWSKPAMSQRGALLLRQGSGRPEP